MLLDKESATELFKELDTSNKGQVEISSLIKMLEDILAGRFQIIDMDKVDQPPEEDEDS